MQYKVWGNATQPHLVTEDKDEALAKARELARTRPDEIYIEDEEGNVIEDFDA